MESNNLLWILHITYRLDAELALIGHRGASA